MSNVVGMVVVMEVVDDEALELLALLLELELSLTICPVIVFLMCKSLYMTP